MTVHVLYAGLGQIHLSLKGYLILVYLWITHSSVR